MAKVCPDHEGSVRRSARKRRCPGEWWKEFPVEEETTRAPTVRPQQHNSPGRAVRNMLSSVRPERSQLILREEPVQSHRIPDWNKKLPHADSSSKRKPFRNESINKDGNAANEPDTGEVEPGPGRETATPNQTQELHLSFNNCALELSDPPTLDRNEGSPARATTNTSSYASHPGLSSHDSSATKPCPPLRHPGTTSDTSLGTTNPNSSPASLRKNADEAFESLNSHRDEERHVNVDTPRIETDQEISCAKQRIDRTTGMKAITSCQGIEEIDGIEGYEGEQTLEDGHVLVARESDNERQGELTPQPSRRLFSKNSTDEVGRCRRSFSKVRAPRKNRSKLHSPSYSFSLQSRHESPDFLPSVQTLSRSRQTSGEQKRNRSRFMQQKALVAKRSALVYNTVATYLGDMKVAISISLNKTTMGEVVLLPRSATGPRRALTGDEFYVVKQGYVECDIGFTSVTLFAGDHLGIPAGQSFEMRNPSASKSELFFFSPRSPLN